MVLKTITHGHLTSWGVAFL